MSPTLPQTHDPSLDALIAAVADASHVDWARAESSAEGVEEAQVIRELRILATLRQVAAAQAVTWGPLELRGVVGKGSFGTVHRAWDGRLNREVALKLLTSQAGPQASSRLLAEGRLLAQVRHPNVVTVFAIDEHDGRGGIAMEFVDGRTLKEIVESQGPFGAHEAVLIGRDLCRALAEVHRLGLLHRDIKAQNVMREAGGRIVLMDFGAGMSAFDNERPLAGTPVYAAPEVLSGERPDAQADLYSLGVLLFFLVTGAFPVVGQTLDEVRDRHARGTRQRLRDLRADLPTAFLSVVEAAIEAQPGRRPASAGELGSLLDRTLGEAAGHGALARSRARAHVRHDSVAVLPFDTELPGTDVAFVADAFSWELGRQLGSLTGLRVVAGATVARARQSTGDTAALASLLDVSGVVEGTMQSEGARIRLVVRLVDAVAGENVWSEVFVRPAEDVVSLQAEVARKVALALRLRLSDAELARVGQTGTVHAAAYTAYLRGRHEWMHRTDTGLRNAVVHFREAVTLDPSYAEAYVGLSNAYQSSGVYGVMERKAAYAMAEAAAAMAVNLSPGLAEARAARGYAYKNRFQWREAEAEFLEAIALKPGYADGHHWYSILLTQLGRLPEALAEVRVALSLDRLSLGAQLHFASVLLMARRYEDAISQYQQALRLEPGVLNGYRGLSAAYAAAGLFGRAVDAASEALSRLPVGADDQQCKASLVYAMVLAGRRAEVEPMIQSLLLRHATVSESLAGTLATVCLAMGDNDRALDWLELGLEIGDPELSFLKVEPKWDPIRADARFTQLTHALNLD